MDKVIATRNGRERIFSKTTWDHLGRDKQGWELIRTPCVTTPDEVKKFTDEKGEKIPPPDPVQPVVKKTEEPVKESKKPGPKPKSEGK